MDKHTQSKTVSKGPKTSSQGRDQMSWRAGKVRRSSRRRCYFERSMAHHRVPSSANSSTTRRKDAWTAAMGRQTRERLAARVRELVGPQEANGLASLRATLMGGARE